MSLTWAEPAGVTGYAPDRPGGLDSQASTPEKTRLSGRGDGAAALADGIAFPLEAGLVTEG